MMRKRIWGLTLGVVLLIVTFVMGEVVLVAVVDMSTLFGDNARRFADFVRYKQWLA